MRILSMILLASLFLFSWGCGSSTHVGVQNLPLTQRPHSSTTNIAPSPEASLTNLQDTIPIKDYGIYSALLSYLIYSEHFGGQPEDLLVINDHTITHAKLNQLKSEEAEEIAKETFADYTLKNTKSYQLKDNFDIYIKHVLIPESKIISPSSKEFGIKYPKAKGIMSISRLGLNHEKMQALAYVEYSCGTNCGEGAFWLMNQKNGVWHFQRLHE